MKRIGVYRGAFDPPHIGHLNAIIQTIEYFNLSKLYIYIKFIGVKDYKTSVEERVTMMKIQIKYLNLLFTGKEVVIQSLRCPNHLLVLAKRHH